MDFGSHELGPIGLAGLALLGLAYGVALPIAGIVIASRRKRLAKRSIASSVWSLINCALFGLATFAALRAGRPPVWLGIGFVLNAIWLNLSAQANRAAARRPDL